MLLPGSYIFLDDVSSNASIRPLRAGSPSFFPYLVLCYKPTSQNFFKHSVCYGRARVHFRLVSSGTF